MRITISYGLSNSLTRDFPEGTTVRDITTNANIMAALGYGNNVSAKVDGVTQEPHHRLSDGDQVDLEVRANTKAISDAEAQADLDRAFCLHYQPWHIVVA